MFANSHFPAALSFIWLITVLLDLHSWASCNLYENRLTLADHLGFVRKSIPQPDCVCLNALTNDVGYWRHRWARLVTDSVEIYLLLNICSPFCLLLWYPLRTNILWCQTRTEYILCCFQLHNYGDCRKLIGCQSICTVLQIIPLHYYFIALMCHSDCLVSIISHKTCSSISSTAFCRQLLMHCSYGASKISYII